MAGCDVEPLDADAAAAPARSSGRAGTSDVVDPLLVEGPLRRHDVVITSDPDGIGHIADAIGRDLELDRP